MEGSRKEFWASVGRRTEGKRRGITSFRNSAGVSVTSTRGKLEVLKRHYRHLGTRSVDTAFDDSWKEEMDKKVCEFSNLPADCLENKEVDLEEMLCIRKLRNNKTGGSDGLVGELLKYGWSGMVA